MAELKRKKKCRECGRKTWHTRPMFSNGWGCLLSILTAGLFIPVWLLIGVWEGITGKWTCIKCGDMRRL